MLNRRRFLGLSAAAGALGAATAAGVLPLTTLGRWRLARAAAQGMPLPGKAIAKWVDPLPDLHITNAASLMLNMQEFQSPVMPTGFVPATGTYNGTWVWGYKDAAGQTATSYIGPVILATRGTTTEVKYANMLGSTPTNVAAWDTSTDQTLHWADPLGDGHLLTNYEGPVPAVPHLHGGEVPPQLDGGPDAWFTSDGVYQGHAYYSFAGAAGNEAIYKYPNTQEAANIWFHDHVLGITRLNVYAGLAGAYLLSDPGLVLPTGLHPYGLSYATSGPPTLDEVIVPLVIQDRMFDVNGQLYFPNLGINPEHPFWIPEFVGDTIVVNGKVWPTFGTAQAPKPAKRYRFLFLNGSNARAYELFFVDPVTKAEGPPMWVIGTDGGYLDTPQKIDPNAAKPAPTKLVLMPGERYDVIVDFADPTWLAANPNFSGTLLLRNTGSTPYPKGPPPQGSTLGQVMKFFIGAPVTDNSYDPASGIPLRPPIVRLVDPAAGTPAVAPQVTRQLTLNEVMGPGGPLEVLVNNTKWGGHSVATDAFTGGIRPDFTVGPDGNTYYSELPEEGQTELWEIVNMTADAHPIHLHLVQFQLMNRQKYNVNKYVKTYDALFPATPNLIDPLTNLPYPGGVFIGGFGPPAHYDTGMAWSALDTFGGPQVTTVKGGNPDVTRWLQGPVKPPETYEQGWKDTVIMFPGEVTRIMVRWAPTDLATTTPAADLHFPFTPNGDHGYVWHCHIIDHEDNEMMRPDSVDLNPAAPAPGARPLKKGTDY
jgi:spore coat protein A